MLFTSCYIINYLRDKKTHIYFGQIYNYAVVKKQIIYKLVLCIMNLANNQLYKLYNLYKTNA